MKRNLSYYPYFLLLAALVLVLIVPLNYINPVSSSLIGLLTPLWKRFHSIHAVSSKEKAEIEKLQQENYFLTAQLEVLKQALLLESNQKPLPNESLQKIGARVVYRDPASWGACCWIDVGSKANPPNHKEIVAKNSPVVVGSVLVGVIDFVDETRSRVRLVTSRSVTPSVRAVRGGLQVEELKKSFHLFYDKAKPFKIPGLEELSRLIMGLSPNPPIFLGKGELRGSSYPLWRSKKVRLQGIGFNYDFPDEEGAARPISSSPPLVQEGDILMTTGMDGIFPKGLKVAHVTRVYPLREGACSFDLEAQSMIADLDDLNFVAVLPPISH